MPGRSVELAGYSPLRLALKFNVHSKTYFFTVFGFCRMCNICILTCEGRKQVSSSLNRGSATEFTVLCASVILLLANFLSTNSNVSVNGARHSN